MPLLRERGANITTRDIAAAAGIAEGTIFTVFRDKEAVLLAALDRLYDPAPTNRRLLEIDPAQPLEVRLQQAVEIIQQGFIGFVQVLTALPPEMRTQPGAKREMLDADVLGSLFQPPRDRLTRDPRVAGQALVALTFAGSNPLLFDPPLPPNEIVSLVLDGIRSKGRRR